MRKITLGEVLDVRRGASLSGEYYATEGSLVRLTLGNFNYPGGGFKENTSKADIFFVGPIKAEYILSAGDIITPLTEQVSGLLGETATIPESDKYSQSGDVGLVVPNEAVLNKRFAYYLVSSPIVKKQLDAAAQQTKIRHTSPDAIKACEAWIPEDLAVQREIGWLLDNINSKISLNSSICSDLEALAKLIYDYWFVQFDFPDENGKPYKSSGGKMVWNKELKREIPEGWEVNRIGDIITTERGISYSTPNIETGNGVPMLNLATFIPGGGRYKDEGLKHYLGEYPRNKVLKPYELIMCNTQQTAIKFETDIIGRCMLVPDIFEGDVVFSHHVNVIKTNSEELKYFLLFLFNSDYYHKYISGFTNGTNILGLSFNGVEDYLSEIPPSNCLKQFGEFILNVEKEKSNILKENRQLASLRDFLLPMLMNGQVTVGKENA